MWNNAIVGGLFQTGIRAIHMYDDILPIFYFTVHCVYVCVAAKKSRAKKQRAKLPYKLCRARQSYNNRIDVITINMISSTTSSSDDNNNNISLSVVQTVKKWIRNSWPFATAGKIDERRPDDAARQDEVLYIHQDECASVDDTTVIDGDRRDEEACRDDNEASGGAAVEDYGSKEALSASLSNGQHDNDNDDYKAGSRVMDIVMASPKKYFLRSSRRRRSCRFQLDDKIDVVARSSNDDESVMASGHFGGLNDIDGADSKVSSMRNSHDDRSKQDNDNNDKQEVDQFAAPALPQDTTTTTTTNHSCSWTQQEITSLRKAYQQSNPTSPTLWQDISTAMSSSNKRRSASECQRKWFSLVATPKKRVGRRKNGRVNEKKYGVEEDVSEEEDDLFDSTPLKCAVQEIENDLLFQHHRRSTAAAATTSAATAKQEELVEQDNNNDTTFHSPIKIMTKMMIKSPLSKRPRMFSPKNKNSNNNGGMKNDGILSPLINRRKGYNTYVNNLRREIGRAQKARKRGDDDDKMSRGGNIVGRCSDNSSRGGRGKGGGSTANKSSTTIRIKEGKGKSQLSAELVDGSFVLNIPQEDSDDENGSDIDLFEEVFRMEDEENEFS
eukprot:scaffold22703_cov84-Skeletonema_dohrnii-CCMP3373.AAC.2